MRAFCVLLFCVCTRLFAAEAVDQAAVLAIVQRLFDAMASHDAAAARAVLLPDGRYASIRDNGAVSGGTHAEFLARLAAAKEAWLERMWEPKVLLRGSIATVWAPYDFHRNGKFSHCGIDSFSLLKTAAGWRIAGFFYTVEPAGCPPSPLGPPK